MKKYILKAGLLFLLIALLTEINGQGMVVSQGGDAIGSGGSISYTIGQSYYQSYMLGYASINEGMQQPFETYGSVKVLGAKSELECNVFPNPFTNYLIVEWHGLQNEMECSYTLLSLDGQVLDKNLLFGTKSIIDLSYYTHGVYFLNLLYNNNSKLKVFKIFKIR